MRISGDHLNIQWWQNRPHGRDRRTWLLRDLRFRCCTVMRSRFRPHWRLLRPHRARRSCRDGRRWLWLLLNQLLVWKPEIAIMIKDSG